MVFSGLTFLYWFLPIVLLIYFVSPKKIKNTVLLAASIFFYTWGEGKRVLIFLFFIFIGYILGLLIEKTRFRKTFLSIGVLTGIIFIGYFKYTDFFIDNINLIVGTDIPLQHIVLPIGISFYTFQIISYLVDVYRKDIEAEKNMFDFATYVALFPQLIAGPIVRYKDIKEQLKNRHSHLYEGIRRFCIGLMKKIVIANEMGLIVEAFKNNSDLSVLFYWLYAIAVCFEVYFDFSGYSDMAIGIGKILGFEFRENFNYPFISKSITEFWRRWHMTLGQWFKDYIYIPLGGNREHQFLNIMIVWALTGLWHGASWNFVLWGIYFGIILIIEKKFLLKHLNGFMGHIYTLLVVIFSFVIFDGGSLHEITSNIGGMLMMNGVPLASSMSLYMLKSYGLMIIIACIASTPLMKKIYLKYENSWIMNVVEPVAIVMMLIICTAYLVDGSFNPFLYFRF